MISDPGKRNTVAARETLGPGEITELVRGNDRALLEQLTPMVRQQDVALDLQSVERIDAAGLAALIKLYCAARDASHRFTVTRPSAHVAEILALVGLDHLLVSARAEDFASSSLHLQESAA